VNSTVKIALGMWALTFAMGLGISSAGGFRDPAPILMSFSVPAFVLVFYGVAALLFGGGKTRP